MKARDALILGRVSNLPTVWANVLAGTALAGAALELSVFAVLLLALTLFYIGGMYLNDAFDADVDARERPERPIPAGRVRADQVYIAGYAMLAAGLVLVAVAGVLAGTGIRAVIAAGALSVAIVWYNANHKQNTFGPAIMGLCRMLTYLTAAAVVATEIASPVWLGAVVSFLYLIGLTYVAKQENFGKVANMWPLLFLGAPLLYGIYLAMDVAIVWAFVVILATWIGIALRFVVRRGPGDIPRAVVSLIAGIALVDSLLISSTGQLGLAAIALVAFMLTLVLQRWIPGT